MTNELNEDDKKAYELIPPPSGFWIGNTWVPPEGSRLYTPQEMKVLFQNECTLFVGDSLQRRASGTLFDLFYNEQRGVDNQHDFRREQFDEKGASHGFIRRSISFRSNLSKEQEDNTGCLDMEWRSHLAYVDEFAELFQNSTAKNAATSKYSKYSVLVVSAGTHDNSHGNTTVQEMRDMVNHTIHTLHEKIPSSVLVVWKTLGYCSKNHWLDSPDNRLGTNYKQYVSNQVAMNTIRTIASPNLVYLDWGSEVFPRSIENHGRIEGNTVWHYGIEARLVFVQMLSQLLDQRKPHLLHPSRADTDELPAAAATTTNVTNTNIDTNNVTLPHFENATNIGCATKPYTKEEIDLKRPPNARTFADIATLIFITTVLARRVFRKRSSHKDQLSCRP